MNTVDGYLYAREVRAGLGFSGDRGTFSALGHSHYQQLTLQIWRLAQTVDPNGKIVPYSERLKNTKEY